MSTILLAAAVAVAAVVCLLLGAVLRELRGLREVGVRPWLVLDIGTDGAGIPAVTVTNVGHGPALDAELTVAFDEHDPDPHTGRRPPRLPQRFHAARLLPPGGHVRFPPPGDPDSGQLAPETLAAWVRAIELTGTATDLHGHPVTIHDRLDDPFRRIQAARSTPAVGWPPPADRHPGDHLTAR